MNDINHNSEKLYLDLGRKQHFLGNLQIAIEHFNNVLRMNPENAIAHAFMALALCDTKDLSGAKREAEMALNLAPQESFMHSTMGAISLSEHSYYDAEKYFMESLRLDDTNASCYIYLAKMYEQTDQNKRVLPILEKGLEYALPDENLLSAIGAYYLKTSKLSKAKCYAHKALQINPESANANVLQGMIALHANNIDEAKHHAFIVLKENANNMPALHLLCQIKMKTNIIWGLLWRYIVWTKKFKYNKLLLPLSFILIFLIINRLPNHNDNLIKIITALYLVFILYMHIGIKLFKTTLNKELREIKIKKSF